MAPQIPKQIFYSSGKQGSEGEVMKEMANNQYPETQILDPSPGKRPAAITPPCDDRVVAPLASGRTTNGD
jgi:hypothetical protein